jgi:hypothetical protein
MKMEQTEGNYPEENIQHTEHGKSLKSRKFGPWLRFRLQIKGTAFAVIYCAF